MISFHILFPLIVVPLILYLKVAGLNGELSVWALEIVVVHETPFVSREKHAVIPTTPVQNQQSTHNGITGTPTLPLRATMDETTTEPGVESKEKSTLRRSSPQHLDPGCRCAIAVYKINSQSRGGMPSFFQTSSARSLLAPVRENHTLCLCLM